MGLFYCKCGQELTVAPASFPLSATPDPRRLFISRSIPIGGGRSGLARNLNGYRFARILEATRREREPRAPMHAGHYSRFFALAKIIPE